LPGLLPAGAAWAHTRGDSAPSARPVPKVCKEVCSKWRRDKGKDGAGIAISKNTALVLVLV
jgi:hypothetical protein